MSSMQWVFLVYLCVASQTTNVWAQATLFSLPLDTVNHTTPLVLFSSIERGPLVERTDWSTSGFVFDATGDGTADDVFVANVYAANEVLVHDGAGGWSRRESGPLVERTDNSYGGFVFDATGDGTADDVFVANARQANEVLFRPACAIDGYAKLDGKCCK
jgi:hypothetical protein